MYSIVEKFQKNIVSPHFAMSKSQPLIFTIDHYAGKVSPCVFSANCCVLHTVRYKMYLLTYLVDQYARWALVCYWLLFAYGKLSCFIQVVCESLLYVRLKTLHPIFVCNGNTIIIIREITLKPDKLCLYLRLRRSICLIKSGTITALHALLLGWVHCWWIPWEESRSTCQWSCRDIKDFSSWFGSPAVLLFGGKNW